MGINSCTKLVIILIMIVWFFSTSYFFPHHGAQFAYHPADGLLPHHPHTIMSALLPLITGQPNTACRGVSPCAPIGPKVFVPPSQFMYPYASVPHLQDAHPAARAAFFAGVQSPAVQAQVASIDPAANAQLFNAAPSALISQCPPAASRQNWNAILAQQLVVNALPAAQQQCLQGHVRHHIAQCGVAHACTELQSLLLQLQTAAPTPAPLEIITPAPTMNPTVAPTERINYACLDNGQAANVFSSYVSEPSNVPVPIVPISQFTDIQLIANDPCTLQLTGAVYGETNTDDVDTWVSPYWYNEFTCQWEDSNFSGLQSPFPYTVEGDPQIGQAVPLKYVGSKCYPKSQIKKCAADARCGNDFADASGLIAGDIVCPALDGLIPTTYPLVCPNTMYAAGDCIFESMEELIAAKSDPDATYIGYGLNSVSQAEPDHWRGITFKDSPLWTSYEISVKVRFSQLSDIFEAGLAFTSLAPNTDDRLYVAFRHNDDFSAGITAELDAGSAGTVWDKVSFHNALNNADVLQLMPPGAGGVTSKTDAFTVKVTVQPDTGVFNLNGQMMKVYVNGKEIADGHFSASDNLASHISFYVGDCTTVHISDFFVTQL